MLPQSLSVTVARTHPAILRWRNQDTDFDGEVTAQFLTAKHEVAMAAPCVTDGRALSCSLTAEQIEQIRAALDSGASKASVCRSFKVARSTLLDTLERVGWTASAKA